MSTFRAKVLVVDDKENMRALLRDIMAGQYEVTLASDGVAAQQALEANSFEVVLTDVRMPGLDGFGLVRLIMQKWPATEVVMMTAYASIPAAVEAIREGAYDYIQKPFDPDDVILVMTRALARQRERAAAATHVDPNLSALSYREALASARDRGSREYLTALLRAFNGNVSRAAEQAGLERESLHRLLRRHCIHADHYRSSP